MVSHVASEGRLSDVAFEGMVNRFLAFEQVVQESAHPVVPFVQDQNIASEGLISDAQFKGMVRKFAEFGDTVYSQASLENPSVPQKPDDTTDHPGSEALVLEITVESMVDRFQDLKMSGNCFAAQEKALLVSEGNGRTQFIKADPGVVGDATSGASGACKNDIAGRRLKIEETKQTMEGAETARPNMRAEAGAGDEEIPELEECEAGCVEYPLAQRPCLSRGETWMRMRCGNHHLHVELPNALARDVEDATVHHFFPDFDYGGDAASQGPA